MIAEPYCLLSYRGRHSIHDHRMVIGTLYARWERNMWGNESQDQFDAAVWSGQVDVTRAVVTLSMLASMGVLWFALAKLVLIQI